ncbi:sulfurtransferase TusA family protein [Candidatus Magnetaquicoccus inordinatus]|uniref:sulfurtransferase TusA family protein n=1 Tax=Candidatus Magnetaquicoccus inordinatus TaxID=2496818 RepID=UPI00102AAFED|nr:sulfurtransferase TusA family protein [Candidatus Magnetaquicoccus inordinatus]
MADSAPNSADHPPQADQTLDARRLLCPLPILRAEQSLRSLPPGAILAILASDPGIQQDLPAWCQINGHALLALQPQGREWIGWVKKGG